jgi:hypothetical protein
MRKIGKAKLTIDNTALSGHVFTNPIDFFGKYDVLDLTGLHFHTGATATYHKATHHLTVHSGGKTDTLTLLSSHGTGFAVANDGHGGTKATLDPPAPTAHAVASLAIHDLSAGQWVGDMPVNVPAFFVQSRTIYPCSAARLKASSNSFSAAR